MELSRPLLTLGALDSRGHGVLLGIRRVGYTGGVDEAKEVDLTALNEPVVLLDGPNVRLGKGRGPKRRSAMFLPGLTSRELLQLR